MTLPAFNMRQLLEAGVHFGHQSHRWNPKMAPFIYGARNNIHIIDLAQTVPLLYRALQQVSETVRKEHVDTDGVRGDATTGDDRSLKDKAKDMLNRGDDRR